MRRPEFRQRVCWKLVDGLARDDFVDTKRREDDGRLLPVKNDRGKVFIATCI